MTKKRKDKKDYNESLLDTKTQYLFEIQGAWIHIQRMVMVFSFIGLIFTTILGIFPYLGSIKAISKLVFLSSAMGCMLTSSVGINIVSRLKSKTKVHYFLFIVIIAIVVASLIALFVKSREYGVTVLWPPLGAVFYSSIMMGIIWRLRSTEIEFRRIERILSR